MTAPDPLTAHTHAAMGRVIDAMRDKPTVRTVAEKRTATPDDRLQWVREALGYYCRDRLHTISDRQLGALVLELAEVVEQVVGRMGGAS